jgi:hypothetical protein
MLWLHLRIIVPPVASFVLPCPILSTFREAYLFVGKEGSSNTSFFLPLSCRVGYPHRNLVFLAMLALKTLQCWKQTHERQGNLDKAISFDQKGASMDSLRPSRHVSTLSVGRASIWWYHGEHLLETLLSNWASTCAFGAIGNPFHSSIQIPRPHHNI